MQYKINNASSHAVYQQIIYQTKRDIALGRVVSGEQLPTVRELAVRLTINPNTIAKAYRQLEQEGIIVTRPGAGAFIADITSNLSQSVKKKLICDEIERVAVEAFHMRINKQTLLQWFEDSTEKFKLTQK